MTCRACGSPGHPSGCAEDLSRLVADARLNACPACSHSVYEHSREPGVGCLRHTRPMDLRRMCPCPKPGTSGADQ